MRVKVIEFIAAILRLRVKPEIAFDRRPHVDGRPMTGRS